MVSKTHYKNRSNTSRTTKAIASKALREVNKLKKFSEIKELTTTSLARSTSSTTFTFANVLNIPEGTGNHERIGDKIKVSSFHYKIKAPVVNTNIRFIVVQTRGDKAQIPLIADVLETSTTESFPEWDSRKNVKILLDRNFIVSTDKNSLTISGRVSVPRMTIFEEGNAVPEDGGIYYCLFSDDATGAGLDVYTRVFYHDN